MPDTRRRLGAALIAAVLAASGAVALETGTAPTAVAAYPETFNPFAIGGGFTIYAREDATLGNTETEGSVAVGGELTKPGDGQFSLVHVVAGTGAYTLPTVDGDPTRLLIGSFSTESGGITAITSAGTSDPSLLGDLKMVERGGPFQPFSRADWLRLNTNPQNPDQTPLMDATHQQYPADAAPPQGATGAGSIYTADTSADAVTSYVEANREASWTESAQCLADVADPLQETGYQVAVAQDFGDRVVLAPLSPDRPNVVDYADIAGTALIQFSPGPEPGVANPLIIRVPTGTDEVIGAHTDPQGAFSPYILWDLSALSGPVDVTAAQGRIDGSIYAPEADVTVTAAPLDGQIIGRTVSTLGGEVHSFMFAGEIACTSDTGSFRLRKTTPGLDPADPAVADLAFTVNYTATDPDGDVSVGSLELPASGEWVDPGERFVEGTVVSFTEVTPPTVPGYSWGTTTITPNPLTITAGETVDVTVENIATANQGTFSVRKVVTIADGSSPALAGTVTVAWTALHRGAESGSGLLSVPLDGTAVSPPGDFPIGTVVTLVEDLSTVTTPPGYEWVASGWSPGQVIRITDATTPVEVTLTNVLAPAGTSTVTVLKEAGGEAADPRYEYSISYNIDPPSPGEQARRTRPIAVGEPITLSDLETGANTLELAEPVPLFDSQPVDVAQWEAPVFRVTTAEGTTDYPTAGFEGAVPLEDAIASIPMPEDGGTVEISVVNVQRTGTFTVAKDLTGIEPDDLPPGTEFTVSWTATTPLGDVVTGTLRLPADGTAVSPVDVDGVALQFPFGTTVTFQEETPPQFRGVVWGPGSVAPDPLIIGVGGATSVAATVTNTAIQVTGTFLVAKDLVGIDAAELTATSFTVNFLAVPPGGGVRTGSFDLPVDGTAAGPVDAQGAPVQFPLGTHILLAESIPPDEALPEHYVWAQPVWTPSRTLRIADPVEPATITVTNTAVEHAQIALTKVVVGEAQSLPDDAVFTVDWWLDGEPQPPLALAAGETVSSDRFVVGSIIEATEAVPPEIAGVTWATPVWTLDGQRLSIEDNGRTVLPVSSTRERPIELQLTNAMTNGTSAGFAVAKAVTGPAAGSVPPGLLYGVEYRIDGGDAIECSVAPGDPCLVDGLEPGALVQVRETVPPAIEGLQWQSPVWSVAGTTLTADEQGWVTVPLTGGAIVDLTLANVAAADRPTAGDLPATGSGGHPWTLLVSAGAILVGLMLVRARRLLINRA
ncbi:choice-of-anchor A family protein [Occultella glacieicola]|uniref:Choice-of-anchor A family protein n=1 Tax=Occultella glacieicola TaxID=2518684 RepID=A0ABY2E582_9MICO|nr:DUF5979 domain-containing protein [Occultella glacieicola]TDE95747.1 choice-of-anchor A family protein [Occultella glacieicola]